jgi:hypothetical protein
MADRTTQPIQTAGCGTSTSPTTGFITYLVLGDQDRVDVLNVTWFG